MKNATCPILMIHGDADKFVPFWMLDKLYDAAPEPKRKLVVGGSVHGMAYNKDPQLYEDTLDDFLETYL
ncbi:alpha/beta hydrolase [Erysipelothrix tonsillarum]|uniref:alpha/beta hydrolase n=1 Tax=Erysipelothrix tonsillarum TaxID=38402 RepID=UPI001FCBE782|nr:alpha/beta hydrolase [Erysipelothrix tonsillarum]